MTRKCNRCGKSVNLMTYWSHRCEVPKVIDVNWNPKMNAPEGSEPGEVLQMAYELNTTEEE